MTPASKVEKLKQKEVVLVFKRIGVGLLTLVLALSLFAFPGTAAGSYTVTFSSSGIHGEGTVADGSDYTFTLDNNLDVVAYAVFSDGSICAAESFPEITTTVVDDEVTYIVSGYIRRIDSRFIKSDFSIHTFALSDVTFEGSGSSEDPYLITGELDLLKMMAATSAQSDSNPYLSACYKVTKDFSFNTPLALSLCPQAEGQILNGMTAMIGDVNHTFVGVLDGNGKTISGLNAYHSLGNVALVYKNGGTIKDLTLTASSGMEIAWEYQFVSENPDNNRVRCGSISAFTLDNEGTIDHCQFTGTVLGHLDGYNASANDTARIGMIAANNHGTIKDCSVNANVTNDGTFEGGASVGLITGYSFENSTISGCTAEGTLDVTFTATSFNYIGGIAGYIMATKNVTSTVERNANQASINVTIPDSANQCLAMVGGVAGFINTLGELSFCANTGNITVSNNYESGSLYVQVGGIAGKMQQGKNYYTQMKGCYNGGTITASGAGTSVIGGLLGGVTRTTLNATATFAYLKNYDFVSYHPNYTSDAVTTWTVNATYVLADDPDDIENITGLTEEGFKDASLVTALNAALGEDIFVAGEDYPIFSWLAETPTPTVVYGDVDGNGIVESIDAALTYAYYNEKTTLTAEQLAAADVDGNGTVDSIDAALIYAYYNEKLAAFPAAGN